MSTPRGRSTGGNGNWSGSSQWSPYGRQPIWPKLLLVGLILVVVIGGSVAIAAALGRNDDPPPQNAALATASNTAEAAGSTASATTAESTEPAATNEVAAPSPATDGTATLAPSPTPTPVDPNSLTSPKTVAETYVRVWSTGSYEQLYDLLSANSQSTITREDFVARYQAIAIEAGIVSVDATVVSGGDNDLLFPIRVQINSSRVGALTDENQIPVVAAGEEFRVDWSPSLIFSGLGDGLVRWVGDIPQRGRILDRKGRPLAETGFVSRVGVVPGQITDEGLLLQRLSELLGMPQETIQSLYGGGEPTWFMPVKDYPDNMDPALVSQLGEIAGVVVQKWPSRVYPAGSAAAHITGYMSEITAEELPEMAKLGYEPGDLVGRGGIEGYAEEWLAGKRGGTLSLVARDGTVIRVLGEAQAEPGMDVVLTVDLDLQIATDAAIGDKVGSAVVLDPNNGQVLAMASRPTFDPNVFVLGVSDEEWARLNDPVALPLVNRATLVGYPTGSVFKVVTAAAGMAHLGLTADSWFNCPGIFSLEGADQTWADWIPGGQGEMNLHRAIYRSCNTVFYQIGAQLDEQNEMWLPDMVRAFGFGSRTGIQELYDIAGVVPDPAWKEEVVGDFWARGDAVNLSIGQGYFLASPLQVAKAYAAITNGGTLYRPYIVLDVVRVDGSVTFSGKTEEMGKLPINGDQIAVLKDGMYDVIHAGDGTAVAAFEGASYVVSGKTGTAETGVPGEAAHGWFGSFAPTDAPRITVVTMVEHGVAGSQSAAPVARRIMDAYFTLYP